MKAVALPSPVSLHVTTLVFLELFSPLLMPLHLTLSPLQTPGYTWQSRLSQGSAFQGMSF